MKLPIRIIQNLSLMYPETDGQPMAENTIQYRWIVTIQGGLDAQYRHDPNVFVAGDLFWYPVEGHPEIRTAPDVLVALGRPKEDRGSYMQWLEDDVPPQVLFEIQSPSTRAAEMQSKWEFYDHYGVEEYYLYDPEEVTLTGWQRRGGYLVEIERMDGWVSPLLGIRFDMSGDELQIFGSDGQRFLSYLEVTVQRDQDQRARQQAQERAEEATQGAEEVTAQRDIEVRARQQAQKRAEEAIFQRDEEQRARQQAQKQAEEAARKAERLAAQLRAMGIDPEA